MHIELTGSWAYGVWVSGKRDWLRDEAGFIRRFESQDSALRGLLRARLVNTTRADWTGAAYVGQVAPEWGR